MGQVFLSGEPVIVTDYHDFPENSEPHGTQTRAGGSAPIRYQGDVRGALTIGTIDAVRSFGRHELDALRRLADMGSMALEQAEMRKHLELAVGSGVEALTEAIDMRDHYTWHHSKNVMELAGKLGERLGLDEAALAELAFAARLHDVGKIGVPDAILLKAGSLNEDEWDVMKQYRCAGPRSSSGCRALATSPRSSCASTSTGTAAAIRRAARARTSRSRAASSSPATPLTP